MNRKPITLVDQTALIRKRRVDAGTYMGIVAIIFAVAVLSFTFIGGFF